MLIRDTKYGNTGENLSEFLGTKKYCCNQRLKLGNLVQSIPVYICRQFDLRWSTTAFLSSTLEGNSTYMCLLPKLRPDQRLYVVTV